MSERYDPDAIDAEEDAENKEDREASKEIIVLLIDADQSMLEVYEEDEEKRSYVECILGVIDQMLRDRVISNSRDELAIVFYNTAMVENQNTFDNVYVFQNLDTPDAERIRDVNKFTMEMFYEKIGSAQDVDPAHGLKFGLWVASQMFMSRPSKTANKKIFLFTNNQDPCSTSPQPQSYRDQLLTKAQELAESRVTLSLLPLVESTKGFDLEPFWRPLLAVAAPPDELEAGLEDIDVAAKLDDLLASVKRHRKRALGNLRWSIAPDLDIGLQIYSLVAPATVPAVKHLRAMDHQPVRQDTAYIEGETGAIIGRPGTGGMGGGELRPDAIKLCFKSKNFPREGGPALFEASEIAAIRYPLSPGLKLLGFKPASALLPYHQLTHSHFLYPSDKDLQGSTTLYLALTAAMAKQNTIAICSYTRKINSEPRLVALLPQVASSEPAIAAALAGIPEGLHMVQLPFSDDLRTPELDPAYADAAQKLKELGEEEVAAGLEAANAMVEALPVPYVSGMLPNPRLQRHYQILEAYALQENATLSTLEEFKADSDETVPDMEAMAEKSDLLTAFMDCTGLGALAEGNKRKAAAKEAKDEIRAAKKGGGGPPMTVEQMAEAHKLDKLTIPILKQYMQDHGLKAEGKLKEHLKRAINAHLGIADEV